MNKFVRTKSPTVSKVSEIFFQQLYTGWTVVVHLCCDFSLWRQMAPQQSAKFKTAFLVNFVKILEMHYLSAIKPWNLVFLPLECVGPQFLQILYLDHI